MRKIVIATWSQLFAMATLLLLASACIDDGSPQPAPTDPRAVASEDWASGLAQSGTSQSKDPSGPSTQTTCTSSADCGYGNRCWYGTCAPSVTTCTSNCGCGYGTACQDIFGNGQKVCGPDFGPYPECLCNANCTGGKVCSNGSCVPGGGGGGGGGCLVGGGATTNDQCH